MAILSAYDYSHIPISGNVDVWDVRVLLNDILKGQQPPNFLSWVGLTGVGSSAVASNLVSINNPKNTFKFYSKAATWNTNSRFGFNVYSTFSSSNYDKGKLILGTTLSVQGTLASSVNAILISGSTADYNIGLYNLTPDSYIELIYDTTARTVSAYCNDVYQGKVTLSPSFTLNSISILPYNITNTAQADVKISNTYVVWDADTDPNPTGRLGPIITRAMTRTVDPATASYTSGSNEANFLANTGTLGVSKDGLVSSSLGRETIIKSIEDFKNDLRTNEQLVGIAVNIQAAAQAMDKPITLNLTLKDTDNNALVPNIIRNLQVGGISYNDVISFGVPLNGTNYKQFKVGIAARRYAS